MSPYALTAEGPTQTGPLDTGYMLDKIITYLIYAYIRISLCSS